MPGVTVTVSNEATGLSRTNVTGDEGRFVVAGLPPGTYDVRAEIAGFKPYRRPLTVAVADNVAVAIVLEVGGTAETVTVVDRPPVVNTSSSELSYLVSSQTIETLPLNGRNYTDLALLQPGVLAYPHRDGGSVVAHGLGISVNGQDPRANVYLLDGTLQNDFTNGPAGSAAGTALGMETVREFRVETNAYGAEFGRIAGGQINVLTKSGSNRYSGSAYEYHRNDALDAANYFDTLGKPDFTRNQFGGTVGGPLAENRLFFFGGIEALVERLGKTISTVVPDDNAQARHPAVRRGRSQSCRRSVPCGVSLAPTGRRSDKGSPSTTSRSISASTSSTCRAVSTTTTAPGRCSRAIPSTTRTSSCRPITRSFHGSSCRATSSSRVNTTRRCLRTRSTRRA